MTEHNKLRCPYCAEELPNGATYCNACKSDIKKNLDKKVLKGRIAGGFVLLAGIGFIVLCVNANKIPSATTWFDGAEPTACDIHAWVGGAVIEGYTKYPEASRLPTCTEATLEEAGIDLYRIRGYVIAPNGFGVESRIQYSVLLEYDGSDPRDVNSWRVIGEPTISQE